MTSRTTGNRHILIVDDDRGFRHAMAALLQEAGHGVVQVGDGRAALNELAASPFDVMLLDVGLPGMSGLDVLAELQNLAMPPRVVMITADDTSDTLLKAVRGQADRYITKPFAPSAIIERCPGLTPRELFQAFSRAHHVLNNLQREMLVQLKGGDDGGQSA